MEETTTYLFENVDLNIINGNLEFIIGIGYGILALVAIFIGCFAMAFFWERVHK